MKHLSFKIFYPGMPDLPEAWKPCVFEYSVGRCVKLDKPEGCSDSVFSEVEQSMGHFSCNEGESSIF